MFTIPTSKDIYIEVNGKKVAIIESYHATTSKKVIPIEEFGNDRPVCIINGQVSYQLSLSRIYLVSENSTLNFYNLKNFNIVIVKPDKRILYTGCEWINIKEGVKLNEPCIETIDVNALDRIEV